MLQSRRLSGNEDWLSDESKEVLLKCLKAERLVDMLSEQEPHGSSPWLATFAQLKALVPPGVYELHKSTSQEPKFYTVLGVGDHTEDGSFLVACIAHYAPHKGNLCYRPLCGEGGFLEPVVKRASQTHEHERLVPRFAFVRHLTQNFDLFVELDTG